MTSEQNFFLKMLTDHITKKKTNPDLDLDWNVLAKWAKIHQVEGILYYQCRNYIPDTVHARLENAFNTTIFHYKNRERVLFNIKQEFIKQDIPYLTIKGFEIAYYYPLPFLRTMGDSDILVRRDDKTRAANALEELGFHIGERNPDYDWTCSINGMLFELHHNLLYQEIVTVEKHAQFFNNFWIYVKDGKLDWNFHFLYLLVHLRKHILLSGAGFRMFMDLAVIMNSNSMLDWKWIETKLNELELLKFAQVCFALIEKWFGIIAPLEFAGIDSVFVEKTTEKIFANGVFGFNNMDNEKNSSVNQLTVSGYVNCMTRLSLFFKILFPNYNNMANSPYYHFIRGREWLLPVAWGYRIYRLIRGRTLPIKRIIKEIMTPKGIIDERENELREWGI